MTQRTSDEGARYGMAMVTCYFPKKWILELDLLVQKGKAPNRSELIRYAVRDLMVDEGVFKPNQKEVF